MSSQPAIQEFVSPNGTVPHIPSNMTIAQFFLDNHHPNRPVRSETSPWLINNDTGRSYHLEEIRTCTYSLANIMRARWNIGDNDCVAFFTPNHVKFPITAWAAHRVGAIAAAANPAFSVDELLYQLNTTKAKLLVKMLRNSSPRRLSRLPLPNPSLPKCFPPRRALACPHHCSHPDESPPAALCDHTLSVIALVIDPT